MATVKINNKAYDIPKLGFGHMEKLESEGYDVIAMFKKNQMFAPASAFIMLCANCDREEANRLAEQHIYGGGNMQEIYQAFIKAIEESDFFRKVLGIEDKKKTKSTKNLSTAETAE